MVDVVDDLFGQGVYLDVAGLDIAGDDLDDRLRELVLIEDLVDPVLPGVADDFADLPGRWLLSVGLDGDLTDSVITGVVGEGGVVDDEVADAAAFDLLPGAEVELLELFDQAMVVFAIFHRIGISGLDGLKGISGHDLQGFWRGPDMGIDAVGMLVFLGGAAVFLRYFDVGTTAFDEIDAAAEVDDLVLVFDFGEQGSLEVDQSDVEDPLSLVQFDELFGCWFKGFGAGTCRDEDLDIEIRTDDLFDDVFQREDRDEAVRIRFLVLRGAGTEAENGPDDPKELVHNSGIRAATSHPESFRAEGVTGVQK